MDSCILKVLQDITYHSRGKYFYESDCTVVVLFPEERGAFPSITLGIYSWGQLKLVMILDKNCERVGSLPW